jgi:hypothetical protein
LGNNITFIIDPQAALEKEMTATVVEETSVTTGAAVRTIRRMTKEEINAALASHYRQVAEARELANAPCPSRSDATGYECDKAEDLAFG